MEFTTKDYKNLVLKRYLKNNITFFVYGPNSKSKNWLIVEQVLKKYNYAHYRISTKLTTKMLNDSVLFNMQAVTSSNTFFMEPYKNTELNITVFNIAKQFFFYVLSVKFNNKIYSIKQINNLNSLYYFNNKLIFYKFNLINIKLLYNFISIKMSI